MYLYVYTYTYVQVYTRIYIYTHTNIQIHHGALMYGTFPSGRPLAPGLRAPQRKARERFDVARSGIGRPCDRKNLKPIRLQCRLKSILTAPCCEVSSGHAKTSMLY